MNDVRVLEDLKRYVSRSRAMAIIGQKLYSDDRPISLRMLHTLVDKGILDELTVPTGGTQGKLPRYFISVESIERFLSGERLPEVAAS